MPNYQSCVNTEGEWEITPSCPHYEVLGIQIDVEDSRSQQRNKEIALKRLIKLLGDNSKPKKKRKISKPSKAAIKKRLKAKKVQSEKKQFRRKDNLL